MRRYRPLLKGFADKGYRYLDAADAFEAYDADYDINAITLGRWGHYSPLGNRIVGRYIADYLKAHELDDGVVLARRVAEEGTTLSPAPGKVLPYAAEDVDVAKNVL